MATATTPWGAILKHANEHPNFNSVVALLTLRVKRPSRRAALSCVGANKLGNVRDVDTAVKKRAVIME